MILKMFFKLIASSRCLALMCSLFVITSAHAAEPLFSKLGGVKVLGAPHLKSQVVTKLSAGAKIEGIERKGMFWKIKTADGHLGYVMMTQVTSGQSQLSAELMGAMRSALKEKRAEKSGSAREREKNAVMGIRGLADGTDLSGVGNLRPNFAALDSLEGISISRKAIMSLESNVLKETELLNK